MVGGSYSGPALPRRAHPAWPRGGASPESRPSFGALVTGLLEGDMDPSRNLEQEAGEEGVRRLGLVGQGDGRKRGILWVLPWVSCQLVKGSKRGE